MISNNDNNSVPPAPKAAGPQVSTEAAFMKYEEKMRQIRIREKEEIARQKADTSGLPYINLYGFAISPDAVALIPKELTQKLKTICFLYTGTEISAGSCQPENPEVKELVYELGERHHAKTTLYLISDYSFESAFKIYEAVPEVRKIIKGVQISSEELKKFETEIQNFQDLDAKVKEATVTDMVSMIMFLAIKSRVSDVHLEAEETAVKIRFRIDGALVDVASAPKAEWSQIVSRIKLISGLKINITDRPQDGHFTIFFEGEKIDMRVSTLPTSFGESVVMRLLRKTQELSLQNLGLQDEDLAKLEAQISRPNGMILTTGPTGSGKTTTLYAILKKLQKPEVKIITLEDPVEYELPGINQSQIGPSRDYGFANGLRSIVRQDPDIIMVGEIRDLETAEISIQAALTGHLVLSTVHTNNAAGAIPRLLALGAKPFLMAPAINAVIGQRLIRRICEKCKTEDAPGEEILARVKKILEDLPQEYKNKINFENFQFYKGKGCVACDNLGYRGRVGIYEIFVLSKEIEKLILSGTAPASEIETVACSEGMLTMVQDGVLKALEGITSLDEVFSAAE